MSAAVSTIFGWLFIGVLVLGWAASCASCFSPSRPSDSSSSPPRPARSDETFDSHVVNRLTTLSSYASELDTVRLWVVEDDELNAASFGDGQFLAWKGLGRLSHEHIDAVLAHEVAHDALRHSRNAAELKDVTDFFGEVVGVVTGADRRTTQTLQRWSGNMVLPRYSRAQELQADSLAVVYLEYAGYRDAPSLMCSALLAVSGGRGGSTRFFASHPAIDERRETIATQFGVHEQARSCSK